MLGFKASSSAVSLCPPPQDDDDDSDDQIDSDIDDQGAAVSVASEKDNGDSEEGERGSGRPGPAPSLCSQGGTSVLDIGILMLLRGVLDKARTSSGISISSDTEWQTG